MLIFFFITEPVRILKAKVKDEKGKKIRFVKKANDKSVNVSIDTLDKWETFFTKIHSVSLYSNPNFNPSQKLGERVARYGWDSGYRSNLAVKEIWLEKKKKKKNLVRC